MSLVQFIFSILLITPSAVMGGDGHPKTPFAQDHALAEALQGAETGADFQMVSDDVLSPGDQEVRDLMAVGMSYKDAVLAVYGPGAEMPPADREIVENYFAECQRIAAANSGDMGVHQFNKNINWASKLPELFRIDNTYMHSDSGLSFQQVVGAIRSSDEYQVLSEDEKIFLDNNLNQLSACIQGGNVEGEETGANVPQLLSRVWSLSNFEGSRSRGNIFPNGAAARRAVMNCLRENLETGGGCYAGFSGRLAALYLRLMHSWIEG